MRGHSDRIFELLLGLSSSLFSFFDGIGFGAFVLAMVGEIFNEVYLGYDVCTLVLECSKLLLLDQFVNSVLADGGAFACLEWADDFGYVCEHSFKLVYLFFSCHLIRVPFHFLSRWHKESLSCFIFSFFSCFLFLSRIHLAIFSQFSGKLLVKGYFCSKIEVKQGLFGIIWEIL